MLAVAALLLLGVVGLAVGAYWQVGRTPAELIDYTKRRLQGHPKLEFVALPVLDLVRKALGEPDADDWKRPFAVPELPSPPQQPYRLALESDDPLLLRVGPGRRIASLSAAAKMAPEGAVIEIDPGDYRADVAVWHQKRLTIRGLGSGARLIASGQSAEGKAIWVIRRGDFTIENIAFAGARVHDRNGAGIRLEGGRLLVRNCRFFDNEAGILVGNGDEIELDVVDSEFSHIGAGDGLSHAIYVGTIKRFRLTGNYIHHANIGHLVKSRARKNRIEYNRLTDETGGRASYELEFPNGGDTEVIGNVIQQGAGTQNSVIVSYGAEGYRWPLNRLVMVHNTIVNDRRYGGTFVRVSPGADLVWTRNNLWVGAGRLHLPAFADSAQDVKAGPDVFADAESHDYRLRREVRERWYLPSPLTGDMTPAAEYRHPAGTLALATPPRFPGAVQAAPD